MSKLVSLALAAEARGKAQDALSRAREQTERLRADLDRLAREIVADELRRAADGLKPGEQMRIPLAASYADRQSAIAAFGTSGIRAVDDPPLYVVEDHR